MDRVDQATSITFLASIAFFILSGVAAALGLPQWFAAKVGQLKASAVEQVKRKLPKETVSIVK